jgi:hypothetical protein
VRLWHEVTTPSGEVVIKHVLPTALTTEPSASCESKYVRSVDGSQQRVIAPPMPGLRATAVTEHTTRIEWWFDELPDDCDDIQLAFVVDALTTEHAVPWVERGVEVNGRSGSTEVTYPDFQPAPEVASAVAYFPQNDRRGRTATILIKRSQNTPPDPPEPLPPVTAPAGKPVSCSSQPTVVSDASGDVLTYGPGDPPTQVKRMTRALSGIDITQASVQIDGLTICAKFTFAKEPTDEDFRVSFTLYDPGHECCGTLRYRRTAGRIEVGHHYTDSNGVYQLEPIENAGTSLRGSTLILTGTLPASADPPTASNLVWTVTTGYFPDDAPDFGDWLPREEPINQPGIRHRDGAVVQADS